LTCSLFHDKERFSVLSVQVRKTAEFRDYLFCRIILVKKYVVIHVTTTQV